ncbi:thioredoxin [Rhizobium binae]|uniref:thioredoxin n=1 Tax=Rhizobium binae TaxID=1138190 RepID=UPI001C82E419|nr:thioredoxin [Rhizobium binae]MBX4963312.1 thioredoxin [Rhizobium binae]
MTTQFKGVAHVCKVDKESFQSEVLESEKPVVVDFWAAWCGPCMMIAQVLEEIAVELEGKVKFAKLNVDQNPELASQFGVESLPTLAIFKRGQLVDKLVGATPKTALLNWISNVA